MDTRHAYLGFRALLLAVLAMTPVLFAGESPPIAPPPARIPTYTVRDLGVLEGYAQSWPTGLNDHGDAVGYAQRETITPGGLLVERQACLFKDGQVFSLGVSPSNSRANAINNHGQIVGQSGDAYAFLWDQGTITWLGSLIEDGWSEANDINDVGQVVGKAGVLDASYWHSILWENGAITDLGVLMGNYQDWVAVAINNSSEIVGTYRETWPPPYRTHAFIWHNGSMWELPGVTGAIHTRVTDINGIGQAVGSTIGCSALWNDLTMECLPFPIGPEALNDHGQIVGGIGAGTQPPTTVGVILHDLMRYELDQLKPPACGHIRLEAAVDINNAGQVLCRGIASAPQLFYAIMLAPINCDIDGDGGISSNDFHGLPDCLHGPQTELQPDCVPFDFDRDLDVDLVDYRSFDLAFQTP